MIVRSLSVWVCRACGGCRGHRLTEGPPGRLLDLDGVFIIVVPSVRSLAVYEGNCTCKETWA